MDPFDQEVILEAVGESALVVADDARHQSHHGVGNDGCSQFAARQYEVAHADLAGDEVVAHALVDAFVVAAENDEVFLQTHVIGHFLVETLTVGRDVDDIIVVALGLQSTDATVDGSCDTPDIGVVMSHETTTSIHCLSRVGTSLAEIVNERKEWGQGAGQSGYLSRPIVHFQCYYLILYRLFVARSLYMVCHTGLSVSS